jgi:DnaJ domain
MSGAFQYRPKFVDIRVRKPVDGETIEREPAQRKCDQVGCARLGQHRAPKSREMVNEYWWFCFEHASDYNRRWNYFSGMSEAELADYQRGEEVGHRPTWTFRADKTDRLSAAMRGFTRGRRPADPFGMFGASMEAPGPARPRRRLTRMQSLALEVLSLDETADAAQIRARYKAEVKRWHPDSNGGDRGAEERLQKVVQAYQALKAAGLV